MTSSKDWEPYQENFLIKKKHTVNNKIKKLQLILLNLGGLIALSYTYLLGWLDLIWYGDATHLSVVIFILFLVGVVFAIFGKVRRSSFIMNQMTTLGLIGTIIGFTIAFAGIDVGSLGDVTQLPSVVGNLLRGVGVAMYTTLTGTICFIWLRICLFILDRDSH